MSQKIFDSHKFAFLKQINLLLYAAGAFPIISLVGLGEIQTAQANSPNQPASDLEQRRTEDKASLLFADSLLPVPPLPIPSEQPKQTAPPPPVDLNSAAGSPNTDGLSFPAITNPLPSFGQPAGQPGNNVNQQESSLIQQMKGSASAAAPTKSASLPGFVAPSSTPGVYGSLAGQNPAVTPYLAPLPPMVGATPTLVGQTYPPSLGSSVPGQNPAATPYLAPLPPMVGATPTLVGQTYPPSFNVPGQNPAPTPYLIQMPPMVGATPVGQTYPPSLGSSVPGQNPAATPYLIQMPAMVGATPVGQTYPPSLGNVPGQNPAPTPYLIQMPAMVGATPVGQTTVPIPNQPVLVYLIPIPSVVGANQNPLGQTTVPIPNQPVLAYLVPMPLVVGANQNPQGQTTVPIPNQPVAAYLAPLPAVVGANQNPQGQATVASVTPALGQLPTLPAQPLPQTPSPIPTQEFTAPPPIPTPVTPEQPAIEPLQERPLVRSAALREPSLQFQGAYVNVGEDASARARLSGIYPLTPQLLFGATLDLTGGDEGLLVDSRNEGLNINELYLATSVGGLPNLRFAVGQLDLTSYFDRNSFAKDGVSQFFNPVFQTNPALAAAGIAPRPGFLANWAVTDNLEAKAAVFSSSGSIGDFALDAFAGEVALRYGNAIIRGTYVTARDAGSEDTFSEAFGIPRGDNLFGPLEDDREEAYGVNAEVYVPNLKLGLFGRYGRYENRDLGEGADTYLFGFTFLDVFTPDDRIGLAYGTALSNEELLDDDRPDVLELYYDFRVLPNIRLGFTIQERDNFSEAVLGFRVKTEFDVFPTGRFAR